MRKFECASLYASITFILLYLLKSKIDTWKNAYQRGCTIINIHKV